MNRELPEPKGRLAWETFTRDQVLAIQKQAYEDGLRDAATYLDSVHPTRLVKFADAIRAMLKAKEQP